MTLHCSATFPDLQDAVHSSDSRVPLYTPCVSDNGSSLLFKKESGPTLTLVKDSSWTVVFDGEMKKAVSVYSLIPCTWCLMSPLCYYWKLNAALCSGQEIRELTLCGGGVVFCFRCVWFEASQVNIFLTPNKAPTPALLVSR